MDDRWYPPSRHSFAAVRAARWGSRCLGHFTVRDDLAASLARVSDAATARGGILTSSGGLRELAAPLNPARSPVSLHYLGRAIDLCLWSGIQTPDDPYAVVPDGTDADLPTWRVLAISGDPGDDVRTVAAHLWRPGRGTIAHARTDGFFDLTALLAAHSWHRIAARPGWRTTYAAVEWWHFECHAGLVPAVSTFGSELLLLYARPAVARTPLAAYLDHVWDGRRFVAPPR
jgi:hypothetical protein